MSIKQLSFKEDALSGFGIIFQSLEDLFQFTVCLQLLQFHLRSEIVISRSYFFARTFPKL
ncbi:hypothetical protein [Cecembia rubra]|uniref:hypothetical protein n=1 Tax=Cecembia rubra TaxID=1485585 RepID=UPI002714ECA4|nr:hypothetical protein [Cecembia rubra]